MAAHDSIDSGAGPAWRALPKTRPWYRKLAAHRLADTTIQVPDGSIYEVRVSSTARIVGLSNLAALPTNPFGAAADLIRTNLTSSNPGWTVEVVRPATRWRSERVIYTQPVRAAAIVVDVATVIIDAIVRGDKLWPEDEDY